MSSTMAPLVLALSSPESLQQLLSRQSGDFFGQESLQLPLQRTIGIVTGDDCVPHLVLSSPAPVYSSCIVVEWIPALWKYSLTSLARTMWWSTGSIPLSGGVISR